MTVDASAGAATSEPGAQQSTEGQAPSTTETTLTPTTETTTTDKPVEETKVADKGEDKPAVAADFKFVAPEGVELDKGATDEIVSIFNDKTLTEAQRAQKVVDLGVKRAQGDVEAHQRTVGEWAEAVRADKELGGDKLAETLATAKKAIELGPPELKSLLETSGLGNHPAVVKWAHAVGKALSESKFVPGGKAVEADKPAAQRMYPGMNP